MENIIEGRVSRSKSRRSSILKKKRFPLEEMNPNLYELDTETSFGKKSMKSSKRRVSFADKPQIKEFEKQPCSSESLLSLKEVNIFGILARNQEIQMQDVPNPDQIVQLMQRDIRESIEEEVPQTQQKPQPQNNKRKSFDIHDYIDRYESSPSMEDTDENSIYGAENKSFYCDTVHFASGEDNMELTCVESGRFDEGPQERETDAFSKSFLSIQNDKDKENIENTNPSTSRIDDSADEKDMFEKSSEGSHHVSSKNEAACGKENALESESWYQEMLEKASKTYDDKSCLSSIDAELKVPRSQYPHAMLHDLMEGLSVKYARTNLEVQHRLPFESITRYLGPKDSRVMENQMPEASDRHPVSAILPHPAFGMIGAVGERPELEVKHGLPFESITKYLGTEGPKAIENRMPEASDRHPVSAMTSYPGFGMIGAFGERSAFNVPPRAKRPRFETESRIEETNNELTLNKYTPTKELPIPIPPSATPSERNSFMKKDEESVLQHSMVKDSAVSNTLQNSDDNEEIKRPQNFEGDVMITDTSSKKSDSSDPLIKQSAIFQGVDFGAGFRDEHSSSICSKTVNSHDINSYLLQEEVKDDRVDIVTSLLAKQRSVEPHNRTLMESDAAQRVQEQAAANSEKQEVMVSAKSSVSENTVGMADIALPDTLNDRPAEANDEEKEDTSTLSPEVDFNRRRSETFYIPKKDKFAFADDEDDAWLVKGVKEEGNMFVERGETFVIPKMRYNGSPKREGLEQSRFSIGDIKKNAKYRMSWVARQELICASTPLRVSPMQSINDISEVMEESANSLKVIACDNTTNLNVTNEALSDDRMSIESCGVKGDAIVSQQDDKDGFSKHQLFDGKCKLDLQKDGERLEETLQNEPDNSEDDEVEDMEQSEHQEVTVIPDVEISHERDVFPLEYDPEDENRVANIKRENVELEVKLAELREKVADKLKEGITMSKILDDVMNTRKEITEIFHELETKEHRLNEKQSAPESCENGDENLERGPETVTQSEEETIDKELKLEEDNDLKKKEEQDKEIQMIIDHARKQLLPWFLLSWSRSHFEFKLFRFRLNIEFEEIDEKSLDFYNILKWESAFTKITLRSNSEGCNDRSKYVTSRMFRHIQSDSLIQKYKTTKCLKELLQDLSRLIIAHKDLLEDLSAVYVKNGLTYVDDSTLETKFSSLPEFLFTRFSIRGKIIEGDAMPRLKLSYHHLFGEDRTEMFQPILERASDQGPMLFLRAVNEIKGIMKDVPRKILYE